MVPGDERMGVMGQTVRFRETLRRLAMIDDGLVEDQARRALSLDRTSALEPRCNAGSAHVDPVQKGQLWTAVISCGTAGRQEGRDERVR